MADPAMDDKLLAGLLAGQPAPAVESTTTTKTQSTRRARPAMPAPGKKTAVISRARIANSEPWTDRVVALLVLCLSFLGAVMLLYGWHKPTWSLEFGLAMALGFLGQGFLTLWQWQHTPFYGLHGLSGAQRIGRVLRQMNLKYTVAVLAGVALSVGGFKDLALEWLQSTAAHATGDAVIQSRLAWGAMIVVCLLIEVIPESVYVDD